MMINTSIEVRDVRQYDVVMLLGQFNGTLPIVVPCHPLEDGALICCRFIPIGEDGVFTRWHTKRLNVLSQRQDKGEVVCVPERLNRSYLPEARITYLRQGVDSVGFVACHCGPKVSVPGLEELDAVTWPILEQVLLEWKREHVRVAVNGDVG